MYLIVIISPIPIIPPIVTICLIARTARSVGTRLKLSRVFFSCISLASSREICRLPVNALVSNIDLADSLRRQKGVNQSAFPILGVAERVGFLDLICPQASSSTWLFCLDQCAALGRKLVSFLRAVLSLSLKMHSNAISDVFYYCQIIFEILRFTPI